MMTLSTNNTTTLPIVSLAVWKDPSSTTQEKKKLAESTCQICHDIGFFLLQDYDLMDPNLLNKVFDMMRELFQLPLQTKQLIDKKRSPHFRGWEGVGSEYTNGKSDIREQVDLWTEHDPVSSTADGPDYWKLLGPNQWFPEDQRSILPQFRSLMNAWFQEMSRLGNTLMEMFAVGLGLEADSFDKLFGEQRMSLTKLIHYPSTPAGQAGVNAHHDTGFLTLLACEMTPGLQVQNEHGHWFDVIPPTSDTLVVNLGEMLQAMTGNYFVATPHRVIVSADERYSIGYFHGPSLETRTDLLPLDKHFKDAVKTSPRHTQAGFMRRKEEIDAGMEDIKSTYKPTVYGEQLWNYFKRSYPDNMAAHYPEM